MQRQFLSLANHDLQRDVGYESEVADPIAPGEAARHRIDQVVKVAHRVCPGQSHPRREDEVVRLMRLRENGSGRSSVTAYVVMPSADACAGLS
ncbi:hypothetical protein [Streptomyces sp. NPDC002763]|uniref:hypothetical protein n=1 Tax=Streptomyces sp. NPDC002763 TaxID=3154427 RepID=UPI003322E512